MGEQTFCRDHRSWFCPCVALWMYRELPIGVALAWFESYEEPPPEREWSGGANPEELDWDDGDQGALC
jgi:hypothetical protein